MKPPHASADVVISSGVFNLCPDKPGVLAEAFRALQPGGRPQVAGILPLCRSEVRHSRRQRVNALTRFEPRRHDG